MKILGLAAVLALSCSSLSARADVCDDIARVRAYAIEASVDTTSLAILSQHHGCEDQLGQVSTGVNLCSELRILGLLVEISEPDADWAAEVQSTRAVFCNVASGSVRPRQTWSNGTEARSEDGRWTYPNGHTARRSDGQWMYPNGVVAVRADGSIYYPNGIVARRSDGRWSTPGGGGMTEIALAQWICGRSPGERVCSPSHRSRGERSRVTLLELVGAAWNASEAASRARRGPRS